MPSRASLLSLPGGRDARQVLPHSRQPGYSRLRTPETQPRVGSLHGLGDWTPSAGSYGPSEYPSALHYASFVIRLSLVLECVFNCRFLHSRRGDGGGDDGRGSSSGSDSEGEASDRGLEDNTAPPPIPFDRDSSSGTYSGPGECYAFREGTADGGAGGRGQQLKRPRRV
eukprot:g25486.t1